LFLTSLANRRSSKRATPLHCARPILRRFGIETMARPSLARHIIRDDIAALRRISASEQFRTR
jgi:hypothetical protein